MASTPRAQIKADVARCLTQLQTGDGEETDLRRRHPLARYRAPHPVFELSRTLLSWALSSGATAMEVLPTADNIDIYFQREGNRKGKTSLPKALQEPLTARFKDMADADVTQQSLQNGTVPIRWQNRELTASATFAPNEHGEQITLQFVFNEAA